MRNSLPERAWPVIVFVLTFLVMAFLTPQFAAELDPPTGDEPFYLQMAISLLHDHDFEMTNNYDQQDYLDFYPTDTTSPSYRGWDSPIMDLGPHQSATLRPGLYEKHGIGVPILVAAAYQLGGRLGAMFFINFLAALLAANMFLLAREISGSLKGSLVATLGLAFSSPLLPYAFLVFPAIPAALMAVYSFRRSRLSPSNRPWQLAGLAFSLAFLPWLQAGYLLLSIPIFCYFLARSWRNFRTLAWVLPPLAVSAGLFLFYYWYLYGTIMPNVGDHAGFSLPLGTLQGIAGLFLDQQWGLVTYSPFYLAPIAGIFLMWRLQRREGAWLALCTVPVFLFFASYNQWWGEWCPPARYLVPILPFAAAPAALVLREARRAGKSLSILLLGLSLFLMGAFVAAPKLMYNQPTGESELFLAIARDWGFDLTRWLPSFVVPGTDIVWQAALAIAVAAVLVWSIFDSSVIGRAPAGPAMNLAQISPKWRRRLSPVLTIIAVGLVLTTGAWFRLTGVDWDSGQHLHPDERFITMVATDTKLPSSLEEYFDSSSSPLNPINRKFPNYSYGTSFLFLAKLLAGPTGLQGYDGIVILGRYLSALADLGTVLLVFFLGRRLYNRWVGILGSFLYATAVLPIQHSHFFVAESFTTFFVVLTFFLAVGVSRSGGTFKTTPKPPHGGFKVRLRRFIRFRGTPPETPGGGTGPLHPGEVRLERFVKFMGTPSEALGEDTASLYPGEEPVQGLVEHGGTPPEVPGEDTASLYPGEEPVQGLVAYMGTPPEVPGEGTVPMDSGEEPLQGLVEYVGTPPKAPSRGSVPLDQGDEGVERFVAYMGTPPEAPGGGTGPLHPGEVRLERFVKFMGTTSEAPGEGTVPLDQGEQGLERFVASTGAPPEAPGAGSVPLDQGDDGLERFVEYRGTPPETHDGRSAPLDQGEGGVERFVTFRGTPETPGGGTGYVSSGEDPLHDLGEYEGTPPESPGGGSVPLHQDYERPWLGGWAGYLCMGAACGLALASKISVALLIPVMGVATLMAYWRGRNVRQFAGLGLALVAMFLAFRIVQPYAFAGTGFFDLRPSPFFWGSVEEQRRMAEGSLDYPYTLQYAGTIPYLFPMVNLFWGLGPALLVSAWGGFGLALYQLWTRRRVEHLLVVLWVGLAFVYFGGQFVKYMRYLLPIYPFLAVLGGFTLWWLVKAIGGALPRGRPRQRLQGLCLLLVLGGTFLWAFAYTRIYTQPVTRVVASSWIYQNVPAGSKVGIEHWDDPLPLNLKDHTAQQYQPITLELYNDDNAAKRDRLVDQLSQLDYIFISSNRLYGSIPRLPLRYPMTSEYYRRLFSGELGFEQVAVFTSYPTLGALQLVDDKADESFTVYDHPKVLIFKKVPSFSLDRVRQLLSAVSLDNVVRQGQKDASSTGLLMPADLLQANQTGGTWTQIFEPQGLPARFPFLSWYLLVQVLSLATLPLGLLALGRLPDHGYPLLKTLGVLLVAYLSWLAASLRLA
ncbi:MAG: hypothetical protein Q7R39_05005, partial [Dehalococcoidia bacterium]|nr:hypothetical protein [Dehalococcoidia bacterium]